MNNNTMVKREVQWAELSPNVYGGSTCDQIINDRWNVYADGDKQDDYVFGILELSPKAFPPGTRVIIEEPVCPDCGDLREFDTIKREHVDKCRCGFDWIEWTYNEYS